MDDIFVGFGCIGLLRLFMFFVAGVCRVRVFVKCLGDSYWPYFCIDPRVGGYRLGRGVWDLLKDYGVVLVDDVVDADLVLYLVGFDQVLSSSDIVQGVPGLICVGRDRLIWVDERVDFCLWDVLDLMVQFPNLYLLSWGRYRQAADYCYPDQAVGVRGCLERLGYPDLHHCAGDNFWGLRARRVVGGWWRDGFCFGLEQVLSVYDRLLVGPGLFFSAGLNGELGALGQERCADVCFSGRGGDWAYGHRRRLFEVLAGVEGLRVFLKQGDGGGVVRDDCAMGGADYTDWLCRSKVVVGAWGWCEPCTREFAGVLNGCLVVKPDISHLIEQWVEVDSVSCRADYADLVEVVGGLVADYDADLCAQLAATWRERFAGRSRDLAVRMSDIFNRVSSCG